MPDYAEMYDFQNLYGAHKAARRGKQDKAEVIAFEMNLAENLCALQRHLRDRTYTQRGYYHFMIYEPKPRSIYAPYYADRVVQHCLCDNIIVPTLEPHLVYDNAACRVSKGTHFALNRLTGFLCDFYRQHGTEGYFLKCDIRKFFDNIDHDILKQRLRKVFRQPDTFALLCHIIDGYEKTPGKGLPLGNQTSQWFALYYLDAMDRLIKEELRIKYYTRYMDDFVLLHANKQYLRECLARIAEACRSDLTLELNEKTQIFPVRNGVDYLGWRFYLASSGKVIKKLRASNKKRLKKRLKGLQRGYGNETLDYDAVKRSLVSTQGHLMYGHTYKLRRKLGAKTVFTRGDTTGAQSPLQPVEC
ncbi:MAG: RNA-directed DNA polymerase [Oscillospiraceae bacterium]|nr:RNA-directed DNA polymerase [Oscillospiraceae bacterium]